MHNWFYELHMLDTPVLCHTTLKEPQDPADLLYVRMILQSPFYSTCHYNTLRQLKHDQNQKETTSGFLLGEG